MTIARQQDSAKVLQPLPALTGGHGSTGGSDAGLLVGSASRAVAHELTGTRVRKFRWRPRKRLARISAALIAVAVTAIVVDRWLRVSTAQSTPDPPTLAAVQLFATPTVMNVTVTSANQRALWVTTDAELRSNAEMWKHAGDPLGAQYLDAVQRRLTRFIRNHDAPPSWDFVWRRSREVIRDH